MGAANGKGPSLTTVTASPRGLAVTALRQTVPRLSQLLRSVTDPGRRAVGHWSIGETAAHLTAVTVLDSSWARGGRPEPGPWRELFDRASTTTLDQVSEINALTMVCEPERDPRVLAARIEREADRLVEALAAGASAEPGDEVSWLAGIGTSPTGVVAHLLSEMLVHGRDIARAEGRSFPSLAAPARLFFETFFLDALQSPAVSRFATERNGDGGELRWELRLRGAQPVQLVFGPGQLTVERTAARAPDVRISADPGVMLLVMFRRIGPLAPMLRRRLVVSGRRPWKLRRLMRLLQMPA